MKKMIQRKNKKKQLSLKAAALSVCMCSRVMCMCANCSVSHLLLVPPASPWHFHPGGDLDKHTEIGGRCFTSAAGRFYSTTTEAN